MVKRIFSLWTFLGIVFGVGLFVVAIINSTENYMIFVSLNSVIMGST